jgi:hypothetical protein
MAKKAEMKDANGQLRKVAEDLFAEELDALGLDDDRVRPANWRLSPRAVVTYLMGGTTKSGVKITPKYIGNRRLIETAVATLATDRALLLLGVPGTANRDLRSCGSNQRFGAARCPAGIDENQIRYG